MRFRNDGPDPTSIAFFALVAMVVLCLCAHAIASGQALKIPAVHSAMRPTEGTM